jgi:hypothetical protein
LTDGAHKHALLEFASDSLGANEVLVRLDWHDGEVDSVLGADRIDLLVNLVVLSAFERYRSGQEDLFAVLVKLVVGDLKQLVTDVLNLMEGVVWVKSLVDDPRGIGIRSVCAVEDIEFISELSVCF